MTYFIIFECPERPGLGRCDWKWFNKENWIRQSKRITNQFEVNERTRINILSVVPGRPTRMKPTFWLWCQNMNWCLKSEFDFSSKLLIQKDLEKTSGFEKSFILDYLLNKKTYSYLTPKTQQKSEVSSDSIRVKSLALIVILDDANVWVLFSKTMQAVVSNSIGLQSIFWALVVYSTILLNAVKNYYEPELIVEFIVIICYIINLLKLFNKIKQKR